MKEKQFAIASIAVLALGGIAAGCSQEPPTVVETPGHTTVVHDNPGPAPAPNVTVTTPAPAPTTNTETHTTTNVPANGGPPTTNTSTTTTGG